MHEARPRLGILGGSFDPPHIGHLVIASEACARLGVGRVAFVPAAAPPHKRLETATSAALRLEMTGLAVADDRRFVLEAVEIEEGLVYSRDTLAVLARRHPDEDLVFIMGSDSLLQFGSWHDPQGILGLCTLAVALRPGDERAAVAAVAARWGAAVTLLDGPAVDVSSSVLRDRVRRGLPLRYLVPEPVERLIRERGLYR